ncbi:restriction endonuclease [Dyadobacter sp. CY356]|uniref:restriction endonuclease n=1 Tax=Dyadobacter sp. CY356 TaxID=2906442 RepID=UPI001F3F1363|nr:restriction endonuclease [Dyadobacter sp. CY356]MCF0057165.1 restriction endonuclease [Dyadobacter sp. CY356]
MGAIVWSLENFVNTILDIVTIKTGFSLSERDLVEILSEEFPNDFKFKDYNTDRAKIVRIRSEEFDEYCWHLRKRLGELDEHSRPFLFGDIEKTMKWIESGHDPMNVMERITQLMRESYDAENPTFIDPEPIIAKIISEDIAPLEVIIDIFSSLVNNQKLTNTIFPVEEVLWDGGTKLEEFFEKECIPKREEDFVDQKFINYLQANPQRIEYMHWRNFERLTGEFFKRMDYEVKLGPGSNDGGVDLRIYKKDDNSTPYIIVQCKRHRETNQVKIETVKSFYTDVEFEGAKTGLIATTSRIAEGGKKVVAIRKYPLQFAENQEIKNWIDVMKKR